MDAAFTRFSCWILGATDIESPTSSTNYSSDFPSGLRESDYLKLPLINPPSRISSKSRRTKRWQTRKEWEIDKEYDVVLVPSDGECMSGSESDGSDWSIGWMEPHAAKFCNDSETDNSFAVLVPCYRCGSRGQAERSKTHVSGAVHRR